MEPRPSFHLRNVHEVLDFAHASPSESTTSHLARDGPAMPPESSAGRDSRIARWAADHCQAGSELMEIFRETPEFGRSLAFRIEAFLDEQSEGALRLLGGGGEAIVFGEPDLQFAIKLLAPPGKGAFGWVLDRDARQRWIIRAGGLAGAVERFAWFEALFDSGLELDQIGSAGDFLVSKQPFIAGFHPDEPSLHQWMHSQGWERWSAASDLAMIANLSWRKSPWIATDVRPENALVAEADGKIRAIDFIVGKAE